MVRFGKRNDKLENKYLNNIDLNLLFPINGVGITTAHDKFVIDDSKSVLIERYEQFKASNPKVTNLYKKFEVKEKKGWNIYKFYF